MIEYPIYEIVIPLLSFSIVFVSLFVFCSLAISRFRKITLRFKVAFISGLSHFLLTTFLCIKVALLIKSEPMAGMLFDYLYFFDRPFWGFLIYLEDILRPVLSYNVSNVIAPFITFSILGSSFYAGLALIIGSLFNKIKK